MPRFSLVIPTLRRPDTLEHALETLTAQRHDDVEIVVQNNGNDPATRDVVQMNHDPRVRLFGTDEVLPMTDNWERALENCTGDFVTFIGDDDGLLPDACDAAAAALLDDDEIVSWEPCLYFWPSFADDARRNLLQAPTGLDFTVQMRTSRQLVERVYAFDLHYSKLPMIYNSFIGRTVIDRVRHRFGRYFFGSSPDITSGVINAISCERFLQSSRPLSVAGISKHSNGFRLTQMETVVTQQDLERDFPLLTEADPAAATNLEFGIAVDLEQIGSALLGEENLPLNKRGLIRSIASAANNNPSRYDDTLALVRRLVAENGFDAESFWIPARMNRPDVLPVGLHVRGPGEVLFVIDGDAVELSSVADAARLVSQLVPRVDSLVRVSGDEEDGPPSVSATPLSFAKGADGVHGLALGWGEPESWGTWSIDRLSTMRLLVPEGGPRVRLGLRYRTVPFPNGGQRIVRCELNEQLLNEWRLSAENAQGELLIELPKDRSGSAVELVFGNPNSKSPAELGIGADVRPLGLGVEQVRIVS